MNIKRKRASQWVLFHLFPLLPKRWCSKNVIIVPLFLVFCLLSMAMNSGYIKICTQRKWLFLLLMPLLLSGVCPLGACSFTFGRTVFPVAEYVHWRAWFRPQMEKLGTGYINNCASLRPDRKQMALRKRVTCREFDKGIVLKGCPQEMVQLLRASDKGQCLPPRGWRDEGRSDRQSPEREAMVV